MSSSALKATFDQLLAEAHQLRLEALVIGKRAYEKEEAARKMLRRMTGMNAPPKGGSNE